MSNALSPEVADALLDRLSSDDAFRELFQNNPRAALKQVGYAPPDDAKKRSASLAAGESLGGDAGMCLSNMNGLADKEAIKAGRDEMRAYLTSRLPQDGFGLCAK